MKRRVLILSVSSGLLGISLYIALLPSSPRLFDEAQRGEPVYQVSLREPLGYLRVESQRDAVSAELELRLQSGARRVSQQITFALSAMDGDVLRATATPYTLAWRQLTTERGAWWTSEPSQLSEGVWLIRSDQSSREREERSRWCLWRSVTQSSESWGVTPAPQRFTSAQLIASRCHRIRDGVRDVCVRRLSIERRVKDRGVCHGLADHRCVALCIDRRLSVRLSVRGLVVSPSSATLPSVLSASPRALGEVTLLRVLIALSVSLSTAFQSERHDERAESMSHERAL